MSGPRRRTAVKYLIGLVFVLATVGLVLSPRGFAIDDQPSAATPYSPSRQPKPRKEDPVVETTPQPDDEENDPTTAGPSEQGADDDVPTTTTRAMKQALPKPGSVPKQSSTIPEDPEFAHWSVNPWTKKEDNNRDPNIEDGTSRPFVVIGIPTIDTPSAAVRRQLQRRTWHHYPNVYHPQRNPKGSILVKYLIGRHWSHKFEFSDQLRKEAQEHCDVVALDMKEGKPATDKTAGGKGHWGLEVEVGMSRKALAWYVLASSIYPEAPYISKGDDDYFLRTVEYESVLRSLHQHVTAQGDTTPPLYWGLAMKWGAKKGDPKSNFRYIGGMSITMHRSHVRWIAQGDSDPAQRRELEKSLSGTEELTLQRRRWNITQSYMRPFKMEALTKSVEGLGLKKWYKEANMDHEDVMVGRLFYDYSHPHTVVNDCRYHDVRNGANVHKITEHSIGMHHVWEEKEFFDLMKRFPDGTSEDQLKKIRAGEDGDRRENPFVVPAKKLPGSFSIGEATPRGSHFAALQGKKKC